VATLAVRPLAPRDIPMLRRVSQRYDQLDLLGDAAPVPDMLDRILAVLPARAVRDRIFVALVDGELCALLALRLQERRFRWDVTILAAGSPRLDATDHVCIELWTALLEYAIRRAGEAGAKRLFASAHEEGPARESLRAVGFEAYARYSVLRGSVQAVPVALPAGMRPQEESDVWSIHQLYHHATPRPVQFAEALTSTAWELPKRSLLEYGGIHRPGVAAFVLETRDGIEGYCRIEQTARRAVATMLISESCRDVAAGFVNASAFQAGIRHDPTLSVVVPGYLGDLLTSFNEAGFEACDERVALVRHTTVPALIHTRLSPLLAAEGAERVPKGVPSYFH
jgi:hypothetical protein